MPKPKPPILVIQSPGYERYAAAISAATSQRRLNNLELEIVADRTLIPMVVFMLGKRHLQRKQILDSILPPSDK